MAYPKKEELMALQPIELARYCESMANDLGTENIGEIPNVLPDAAKQALLAASIVLANIAGQAVADNTPFERLTETGIANGVAELIAIMKNGNEEQAATAIGTLAVGVLVNINRIADALEEANKPVNVENNDKPSTSRNFIGQPTDRN